MVEWRHIPIEAGKRTDVIVDEVPDAGEGYEEAKWPAAKVTVTLENAINRSSDQQIRCQTVPPYIEWPVYFLQLYPGTYGDADRTRKEFDKEVDVYDRDALVNWARQNLYLAPGGPYVHIELLQTDKFTEWPPQWGYEVDGSQLRALFDRLTKRYDLALFSEMAYEKKLALIPQNAKQTYLELAQYIGAVRAKIQKEIQSFYLIADRLDRASR